MQYTLSLPLSVFVSKRSRFYLNLNKYRNAHFQILNKAKAEFSQLMSVLIKRAGLKPMQKAVVSYEFFAPDRRRRDLLNVIAVVDKFALDALVSARILPDDNVYRVEYGIIRFAGIDKEKPRVDMNIRPKDKEAKNND
jgi:crossover junction endodeoxyribonuclease RusA